MQRKRGQLDQPGAVNRFQSFNPSTPIYGRKLRNYCYRTFAFDDGQLSINSSESEVSEHIYEEIKDQSSSEEDEEEENNLENESFMLSISLERRNHLKLYGCLDWDFKPVGH